MSLMSPRRMPPCSAAPTATTSSGLISRFGSRPNNSSTMLDHHRRARLAADQQHLIDLIGSHGRRRRSHPGRDPWSASTRSSHHFLEGRPRPSRARQMACGPESSAEMNGRLIGTTSVAVDSSHLASLRRLLEPLQRHPIALCRSIPVSVEELRHQPIHDLLIEVLTTEKGVASGRLDLENPRRQFQNRDVEGTATQVVDRHRLGHLIWVSTP